MSRRDTTPGDGFEAERDCRHAAETPSGKAPRHLLTEAARFLVVGTVATLVALGGFNSLVHGAGIGGAPLRSQPLPAFVLANTVAGCVAWFGMRRWAFDRREVHDPAQKAVRFFALGALTMTVPFICLGVSRYLLELHDAWADNLATLLGLGLGAVIRFFVFRQHVFTGTATRATAGAIAASPR